jgi:hypothetical protein
VGSNDNRSRVIISDQFAESTLVTRTPRDSELLLIKAAQVWSFYDTVVRHGGPVASLCNKAGLPLDAVRDKRGVVGEHAAWRFVHYAARKRALSPGN